MSILLLIARIIGSILVLILSVMILLLGMILCIPIRYEGKIKIDGSLSTLSAKGTFSWLFHFINGEWIIRDGKMHWRIRVAGKNRSHGGNSSTRTAPSFVPQNSGKKTPPAQITKETRQPEEPPRQETKQRTRQKPKDPFLERLKKWAAHWKDTLQNWWTHIRSGKASVDTFHDMMIAEPHKQAFHKIRKELSFLIRKTEPKQYHIKLRYGCEDPCLTGELLAGFSVFYPFLGDHAEIIPNFQGQQLQGSGHASGKLFLWVVALVGLRLVGNKKVRTTYTDFKNYTASF